MPSSLVQSTSTRPLASAVASLSQSIIEPHKRRDKEEPRKKPAMTIDDYEKEGIRNTIVHYGDNDLVERECQYNRILENKDRHLHPDDFEMWKKDWEKFTKDWNPERRVDFLCGTTRNLESIIDKFKEAEKKAKEEARKEAERKATKEAEMEAERNAAKTRMNLTNLAESLHRTRTSRAEKEEKKRATFTESTKSLHRTSTSESKTWPFHSRRDMSKDSLEEHLKYAQKVAKAQWDYLGLDEEEKKEIYEVRFKARLRDLGYKADSVADDYKIQYENLTEELGWNRMKTLEFVMGCAIRKERIIKLLTSAINKKTREEKTAAKTIKHRQVSTDGPDKHQRRRR